MCMYVWYVSHVTKEINLDSSVNLEDFSAVDCSAVGFSAVESR